MDEMMMDNYGRKLPERLNFYKLATETSENLKAELTQSDLHNFHRQKSTIPKKFFVCRSGNNCVRQFDFAYFDFNNFYGCDDEFTVSHKVQ